MMHWCIENTTLNIALHDSALVLTTVKVYFKPCHTDLPGHRFWTKSSEVQTKHLTGISRSSVRHIHFVLTSIYMNIINCNLYFIQFIMKFTRIPLNTADCSLIWGPNTEKGG